MKIVVIGKQGGGKTKVAEAIKQVVPQLEIVDDWDGISDLPDNCIALTNVDKAIVTQ